MSADYLTGGAQERARGARADATCAAPSCWADAERVRVGERVEYAGPLPDATIDALREVGR